MSHPCESCGAKIPMGLMHERYCEECRKSPLFSSYAQVGPTGRFVYGVPVIENKNMGTWPTYLFVKRRSE